MYNNSPSVLRKRFIIYSVYKNSKDIKRTERDNGELFQISWHFRWPRFHSHLDTVTVETEHDGQDQAIFHASQLQAHLKTRKRATAYV
jgi:hypothetical protein